jgi:hypothetical protein
MRRYVAFLLVFAFSLPAEKKRDWQEAIMLDAEGADAYMGNSSPTIRGRGYDFSPGAANSRTPAGTAMHVSSYGIKETYVFQDDDYTYVASRLNESDKPSRLTEMKTVRFAIEKKSVYLLDDRGREFKAKLIKKLARKK